MKFATRGLGENMIAKIKDKIHALKEDIYDKAAAVVGIAAVVGLAVVLGMQQPSGNRH
jgi:hypothetical protein